jgi:ketosteroid isomerase-like protein
MHIKKGISIAIVFLFFTICLSAQSKAEKMVASQIEIFHQAMVNADEAALNDLVSDQLSYGHSNGAVEDKKAFILKLTNGSSDYTKIDVSNQSISISGDVAVVRQHADLTLMGGGKVSQLNLMVLMVWQKSHGKWKLLTRQGVKVV